MAESAISGLVQGFMQGYAIKQQKKEDKYNKERQTALDHANAAHVEWQKGMETERLKMDKDAAKEQQAQFDMTNYLKILDEKRKEKLDTEKVRQGDARLDLSQARIYAGMDKVAQTLVTHLFEQGVPFEDAVKQAQSMSPRTPGAIPLPGGGPSDAIPLGGGLPGNSGIPEPSPLGGPAGMRQALPPAVMQGIMQSGLPANGQASPQASPQVSPAGGIGVSPIAQSKLGKSAAQVANLDAKTAQEVFRSKWMEIKTENEKHNQKLIDAKVQLTHAQKTKTEYMMKIDGDLKKAETMLTEARVDEAKARTDLDRTQKTHVEAMDSLKASSNDLNTEVKKANFRKQALAQEGKIATDRRKAEDSKGKLEAVLESYKVVAGMDEAKVKPGETQLLAQIKMAKSQVPYLERRIAEMNDRITAFTKDEKAAHEYSTSVTNYLNKDGSVNKPATQAERDAAKKAASKSLMPLGSLPGVKLRPTGKTVKVGNDLRSVSTEELLKRLAKQSGGR